MIREEGGKYCVYSHDGSRKFGCYGSRGEAEKRLKQIEYFKHIKSGKGNMEIKQKPAQTIPTDEQKAVPGVDKRPPVKAANREKLLQMMLAAKKVDPNAEVRNRGNVVFPAASKKVKDKKDHFPINNANQARNALSRVAQYSSVPPWYTGSLDELKAAVQSAVKGKYPDIEVTKSNADVNVKSPPGNDPKVPQVETPKLEPDNEKVYAAVADLSLEKHKAFASQLVKQLQMDQERLTEAITLAEKLLDEGLTPEEFNRLVSWTQMDVLMQLLH